MGNCQKSFGITIRLLRLSRKLKQEQGAEKSGLSLRHIKSIERGLSEADFINLGKNSFCIVSPCERIVRA